MTWLLLLLALPVYAEFTPLPASTPESTNSNFKAIDEEVRRMDALSATVSGTVSGLTTSISYAPGWTKYSLSSAAFATAAYSSSTVLVTLPAKTLLSSARIKHTTPFSGGSLSEYYIDLGSSPCTTGRYATQFDVFSATSPTNFQISRTLHTESDSAPWPVYATATSTGAYLNAAVAGGVDIWLQTSLLP